MQVVNRLELVDQGQIAAKSLMKGIASVAQPLCRRVGHKHIKAAVRAYLRQPAHHLPRKILLRIVEGLGAAAVSAAKADEPHAFNHHHLLRQVIAALRRVMQVLTVMIARHIQKGGGYHGRQKGEVGGL